MRFYVGVALVLVSLVVGSASVAQDAGGPQPTKLLRKLVAGMPKDRLAGDPGADRDLQAGR